MKQSLLKLLVLLVLASLTGCKDNLTEKKAEEFIKESIKFPITNTVTIDYGLVAYRFDSLPRYYYVLAQQGVFRIEYLGMGGLLVRDYRFRITLTDQGKTFLVKEVNPPVEQGNTGEFKYSAAFKTSETEFDKIRSIHEIPSLNAAEVRYAVKQTGDTPFEAYYSDKKNPGNNSDRLFKLVKTNDGWAPYAGR